MNTLTNEQAVEQFKALAKYFQLDHNGVDLILEVAAEAMQSKHFVWGCGLPEALKEPVGTCLYESIDMDCNGCLHALGLKGRRTEEILSNLTAEQIGCPTGADRKGKWQ